jgi:transcriptional repressor NrdR
MRCPYCRHADSRVVDSREADDGQLIRRRRSCPECGKRFTTVEEAVLAVVKRSGVTEPFSRTKIMSGVRKACQGRPVDEDAIALLAQKVEETVRARGAAEIPSHDVGLAILGPLRDLDEVAYLRFASVYKSFDSLDEFEKEIAALREASAARERATPGDTRTSAPRGVAETARTGAPRGAAETARTGAPRGAAETSRAGTTPGPAETAREGATRGAAEMSREGAARGAAENAREAAARHAVAARSGGRGSRVISP